METDELLDPITTDAPCGPDLEYDSEFMALDQASRGKAEQQFGDTIVPAEEPDWADVQHRAVALFPRTKDLRIGVLLTRALTRVEGMPGLASGLKVICALLERYWEQVHPCLDPEDGFDPTMRLNVLAPLADPDTLLQDVRSIMFAGSAEHGRLSMRDALIALGKLPVGSDIVPSLGEVENVLRASKNVQAIEAAREAIDAITRIQAVLKEQSGDAQGPDLAELVGMLKAVVHVASPVPDVSEEAAEGSAASGAVAIGSGEIRSREDAVRLLDKICAFIERTEPANPAPLLLRRAPKARTSPTRSDRTGRCTCRPPRNEARRVPVS